MPRKPPTGSSSGPRNCMAALCTAMPTTGWPRPGPSSAWRSGAWKCRTSPRRPRPCPTSRNCGRKCSASGVTLLQTPRGPPVARSTDSWDESDVRIRPNKKGSRPRTKDRPSHEDAVTGRIITVDRGRYTAVVGEDSGHERTVIAARARELRRSPVVAGDFVSLVGDVSGAPDTLARLVKIQDRKTLLRRSADDTDPVERAVVANADQLVVVVAAANPEPRTGFIDRALVAAYDAGIEPLLLVTKADVKDPTELLSNYRHLDFPVIISRTDDTEASGIDARSDDGLSARLDVAAVSELRAHLDGK